MTIFEVLVGSAELISRKIWRAENSLNFHTVVWYRPYLPFIDLGCVSKVVVSRKGGLCSLHCFQMRPRDAAASKQHWLMVLKPNLVIVCSLPPFRSWSPKTFVYIICFDSTFCTYLPIPTCCSPKGCPSVKRGTFRTWMFSRKKCSCNPCMEIS